jgi:hypothetical protein
MDCTNIKNMATLEMVHKGMSLAAQDVFGTKSPYCWDDLLVKHQAIKAYNDSSTPQDIKECICQFLNETTDSAAVAEYITNVSNIYVSICCESAYRGTISNFSQMLYADEMPKVEGWWWSITGDFTYQGVDYVDGDEIYWNGTGFHFYGGVSGAGNTLYTPYVKDVETGELFADTDKSVIHGMYSTTNKTNFRYIVSDSNNTVLVDSIRDDPDSIDSFIIRTGVDVPGGLTVTVFAY